MEMKLLWTQVQVSIAVAAILLLRPGMKKLPKIYCYVLWLMVFGRLLCPVTFESRIGLLPSAEKGGAWVEQMIYEKAQDSLPELYGESAGEDGDAPEGGAVPESGAEAEGVPGGVPQIQGVGNGGRSCADSGSARRDARGRGVRTACLALWCLGAAVVLGRSATALAGLCRRLRGARLLRENVYVSRAVSVPFTLGLVHPRIYLPEGLEEGEMAYILCHERVHIRRKDYLVKNAAFLLTALYWFNPFVWAAFHFLESDMEMSCDEKVVELMGDGLRQRYAQSLLEFARGRDGFPAAPLTFGKNDVRQRVKNILSHKYIKRWGAAAGASVLLAVGAVLFTTGAGREPERSVGEVYWSEEMEAYEAGRSPGSVTVLAGEGGIFRLEEDGDRCLYPFYVNPEAAHCSEGGILYFMADFRGADESGGYQEDVVCMLDPVTGKYDRETLRLDESAQSAPVEMLHVGAGFVSLYQKGRESRIPLVNTGETELSSGHKWKGKAVGGLDEREMNAYGAAVREQLCANPGMVLLLSNRTMEETFAIVDMDGDGQAERISLGRNPDTPADAFRPEDWYCLWAERVSAGGGKNGRMTVPGAADAGTVPDELSGRIEGLKNDIWAFCPDGSRIVLALCGEGSGADDPSTYLYTYGDGGLRMAGVLPGDIGNVSIEDGILEGTVTVYDVLMPLYLKVKMRLDEAGELEEVPQDEYDFCYSQAAELLVSLPVHDAPGGGEVHYMEAQPVSLMKIHKSFQWIYLEGENGDSGWFAVDGEKGSRIAELNLDSTEVFLLYYAG